MSVIRSVLLMNLYNTFTTVQLNLVDAIASEEKAQIMSLFGEMESDVDRALEHIQHSLDQGST